MEFFEKKNLSPALIGELVDLFRLIWPPKDASLTLVQMREKYARPRSPEFNGVFIVREGNRPIAHAEVFSRPVFCEGIAIRNLALAGVCVHPDCRGLGLGAEMVRRAFALVDAGQYECSIFQTGVPAFYEKLGAQIIEHTFVNSRSEEDPRASPWWDKYVMIYPAGFELGEGVVDLNGEGY